MSLLIGGATLAVFGISIASGTDLAVARTEAVHDARTRSARLSAQLPLSRWSSLTLDVFRGNPAIQSALALIVFQLIYTYVPFLERTVRLEPLTVGGWLLPIAFSVAIFLAVECSKRCAGARRGRHGRSIQCERIGNSEDGAEGSHVSVGNATTPAGGTTEGGPS
ncbi:MAG: cation transporting ATPase C-terminal domain-containing protein [Microbacterium sp.]